LRFFSDNPRLPDGLCWAWSPPSRPNFSVLSTDFVGWLGAECRAQAFFPFFRSLHLGLLSLPLCPSVLPSQIFFVLFHFFFYRPLCPSDRPPSDDDRTSLSARVRFRGDLTELDLPFLGCFPLCLTRPHYMFCLNPLSAFSNGAASFPFLTLSRVLLFSSCSLLTVRYERPSRSTRLAQPGSL